MASKDDGVLERQDKAVADVVTRFARMVGHSVEVMEKVGRTNELSRGSYGELVRPPEMSEADFNLHKDAMQPPKDVPFYLRCHANRVELGQRISGERTNAPPEIARKVVRVLEVSKPREYDVIDVEDKKE
jgi:hypothetical protein